MAVWQMKWKTTTRKIISLEIASALCVGVWLTSAIVYVWSCNRISHAHYVVYNVYRYIRSLFLCVGRHLGKTMQGEKAEESKTKQKSQQ